MPLIVAHWNALSVPLLLASERPWLSAFLLLLGSWSLLQFTFKTASVLAQTFVLPGSSLNKFGAKKGAWAVVTGASDGIGQEFALQLAKAGFNILLVARNQAALAATAAKIEKSAERVSTKIQLIDFSNNDEAAYAGLAAACEGLDIGILVNNVGKSHEMPTYFVDTPQPEIDAILAVNIAATLRVTSTVLPGMVKRKRGLVLNMGSFAGAVPSPMLATYSGSKAFLATWSAALAHEVRAHGITVEHLNTFFVVSKMSKIRRASPLVPTPAAYVRAALGKIALPCGAALSGRPGTATPYWTHALADYSLTLVGWKSLYIWYTHALHRGIRKRALRKLEREGKRE